MKRYSSKNTVYIAIESNLVIASSRTLTDLSKQLRDLGKGRLFYSRKFKDNNTFKYNCIERVVWFYKIVS